MEGTFSEYEEGGEGLLTMENVIQGRCFDSGGNHELLAQKEKTMRLLWGSFMYPTYMPHRPK